MLNDFAGIQSAWWKWSSFFRIQRIKSVITVKRMTLWIFLHFLHDTNFPFVFGVRFSYSAICFWICFHLLWKILWFGTFIKFIPLLNVCVCVMQCKCLMMPWVRIERNLTHKLFRFYKWLRKNGEIERCSSSNSSGRKKTEKCKQKFRTTRTKTDDSPE